MAATSADADRLLAERAVERVIQTYFRGIDRLDGDLIRSAYHDYASMTTGRPLREPGRLVAWLLKHTTKYDATMYTLHNVLVDLEGGRRSCGVLHRLLRGPRHRRWAAHGCLRLPLPRPVREPAGPGVEDRTPRRYQGVATAAAYAGGWNRALRLPAVSAQPQ